MSVVLIILFSLLLIIYLYDLYLTRKREAVYTRMRIEEIGFKNKLLLSLGFGLEEFMDYQMFLKHNANKDHISIEKQDIKIVTSIGKFLKRIFSSSGVHSQYEERLHTKYDGFNYDNTNNYEFDVVKKQNILMVMDVLERILLGGNIEPYELRILEFLLIIDKNK